MQEDIIANLKKLDFLSEQKEEIFEALSNVVAVEQFQSGELVFCKGDAGGAVYIILKGQVQIHDGGHIFIELGPGKCFGEYSIVETETRSASATVKEQTTLIKCTQENIRAVERKFQVKIIDTVFFTLRNIRSRMLDKDFLEEELTRQKAKIEEQRKELERLNATKDKFFSIIAHDLKNPFASLIGASDLLVDDLEKMNQEQVRTFVEIINQSARQGFRLLQNLLQWARMQTGRIAFEPKRIDLWDLVNEVVLLYTSSAQNKGIEISAEVDEDLWIGADGNMVNTVVRNLVSNAVKFTPQGGTVKVVAQKLDEEVEIWVCDTGVGIPPEDIDKLFRIDVQYTKPGTQEEGGTGLGLILCKEFVERHNGRIWVESQPGVGTYFKFTLPLQQPSR
ncbi:MAG: ATP-binding protein [Marinifilaceae bacterium]|jgi:signal transduction histidine kinase